MSIAALTRVALIGQVAHRDALLEQLQAWGRMHLDLQPSDGRDAAADRLQTRRALAFLLASPVRRHPVDPDTPCDAQAITESVLRIEARLKEVDEARRHLQRRMQVLAPWGEHKLDPALLSHGMRLWFYVLPHWKLDRMPAGLTAWHIVARDQRDCWIAVVHPDEPGDMPAPRVHTGSLSWQALQARAQALAEEHDDLMAERVRLTRWCGALAGQISRLEDESNRRQVAEQAYADDGLFIVTGWVPAGAWDSLARLAARQGCALSAAPAAPGDAPPTLLENAGVLRAGQSLLTVFLVPRSDTWDPSGWVLLAFCLFFGMVMADAGYALIMALGLLLWRPGHAPGGEDRVAGAMRRMAWILVGSTAAWGLMTGTWFGTSARAWPLFGPFAWLDPNDVQLMMRLSLGIGILHLAAACGLQAWQRCGWPRVAALGWLLFLLAAGAYGLALVSVWPVWAGRVATWSMAAGLLAALAGALAQAPDWAGRLAAVLGTAMRLPAALGDSLSYLRLFALGYAGASLAGAFNDLAQQTAQGVPGFGVLLAGLLLLLGHGLNLVLGVAGGFVHGLRLNFIEFLNWSGIDEGRPFIPFQRKETPPWTAQSPIL